MTRRTMTAILICLLFNGCYSIDQNEGGITGVVIDADTGETLENVKIARGYTIQAPVEQLPVKKRTDLTGEFDFPTGHKVVFKHPFQGCRLHARYMEFHYYFSKPGYRGVSIKVNPTTDHTLTVRLAKYDGNQTSGVQSEEEDSGWTTFMKFNSTSLEVVTGLPAGVTVGALAIPFAIVFWPASAIGDMF